MFTSRRFAVVACRGSITVARIVAVTGLVVACGAGSSTALTTESSSSSAARTPEASAPATSGATETPAVTAETPVGPTVSGGGITIGLPEGWRNGAALSGTVSSYLNSIGVGQGGGSQLILAVGPEVAGVVRTANVRSIAYIPDVTLLETTWNTIRTGLESSALHATHVSEPTRVTVAGETAEQFTADEALAGLRPGAVTELFVSHGGSSYVVTFSYSRTDPGVTVDIRAILSSWSWG